MESVRFGVRGRGRGDRVICTVKRTCKNGSGERERRGEDNLRGTKLPRWEHLTRSTDRIDPA